MMSTRSLGYDLCQLKQLSQVGTLSSLAQDVIGAPEHVLQQVRLHLPTSNVVLGIQRVHQV